MSLACLTCQNVTRTHSDLRSYSLSSQDEENWRSGFSCWSSIKRHPHQHPSASGDATVRAKIVPLTSSSTSSSVDTTTRNPNMSTSQDRANPRLTRCHAVRRDIFRDWHFEDLSEGNRLCLT